MFYQSSVARLNNFLRKPDCPPLCFFFPHPFYSRKNFPSPSVSPSFVCFPLFACWTWVCFFLILSSLHPSISFYTALSSFPPNPPTSSSTLFVYFASFCLFFTFVCTCVCVRQSITPLQFIIILSTAPSNWILSQSHLTSRQAGMGGKTGAFSLHLAQPLVSTSINSCKVVLRPVRFLFSLTLADITLGFYKRLMCTEEWRIEWRSVLGCGCVCFLCMNSSGFVLSFCRGRSLALSYSISSSRGVVMNVSESIIRLGMKTCTALQN